MTDPVSSPLKPKILLMLAAGVWACSTAVIWIRLSPSPPAVLSAWRLLLSVVFLIPLFFRAWQSADLNARRAALIDTALPGAALAAHFITWTLGARMTDAANATLIVNMVPIAMPFMLWFTQRERITRMELIGTVVALGGVLLLFAPGFTTTGRGWAGEWLCLGSMLLIALYLAWGRMNRRVRNFWLYLIPVYAWASLICMVAAAFMHPGEMIPALPDWTWLVLLAVVPTIIGHGLLNYVLRHAGGQVVSVANQGQFIFAAPMAWWLFHEQPPLIFYPAAALILFGCRLATKAGQGRQP